MLLIIPMFPYKDTLAKQPPLKSKLYSAESRDRLSKIPRAKWELYSAFICWPYVATQWKIRFKNLFMCTPYIEAKKGGAPVTFKVGATWGQYLLRRSKIVRYSSVVAHPHHHTCNVPESRFTPQYQQLFVTYPQKKQRRHHKITRTVVMCLVCFACWENLTVHDLELSSRWKGVAAR